MRTCAGGLLVRGRTILVAKRSDDRAFYPGVWDVPGGHCNENEAPAETLVRELHESSALRRRSSRKWPSSGSPGRLSTEKPDTTCSWSGGGRATHRSKALSTLSYGG